jgi:alkylation response protein AidB-like acyl-CoA dehydrogenase
MYFAHTEEQEEFRLSLRRFFGDRLPHAQLPELLERDDLGTSFWAPLAQQLGVQGLTIAEERGGSGFGMVELAIVLEEAGRALVPEPLFATLLGVVALELVDGGGDLATAILPEVAAGDRILAVALTDDEHNPVRAQRAPDGDWRVTGTKVRVLAGQLADTMLVLAATEDGTALFAVESGGARIEPVRSLDVARPLATVGFNDAPAALVGERAGLADTLGLAGALLLAAEQVGGAGRCLDIAVEYAKERKQFGRPIGSFQAVKHRCADMLVEYEAARTALMYASWAWDDGAGDRVIAAAAAKSAASDAYWANARSCIQILGGIGFTTEHPAQLHFKRATVSAQLFGSAAAQRELIVSHLAQEAVTA